jgi:excisionase family DNA binding protein
MHDQPLELTVTEDPVTGTWTFTLHGHQVEIERTHGFVKIDGILHHEPRFQGLQDVAQINGPPLAYLTSLLKSEQAGTPSKPGPEYPEQPPAPPKTKAQAPRKKPAAPRPSTPATASTEEAERTVLPTETAATYLGLSPKTLETLRTRGGGPPFLKLGRRVVYRKADLDTWLAARVRRSTSDPGQQ